MAPVAQAQRKGKPVAKATATRNLVVSGPMLGYVEHREALVWAEVRAEAKSVGVRYWPTANKAAAKTARYGGALGQTYNPCKMVLPDLPMATPFTYQLVVDGQAVGDENMFSTKTLWEYRSPAPDLTFVLGSCLYLNDSAYDRPGKPYGLDPTRILASMANARADFNLWLGDNLYLREADYSSPSGIRYRYSHDRATPALQPLLAARPNYALWDDHDFGYNDANSSYRLAEQGRQTFMDYWGNMAYGDGHQGIYSTFSASDCDFFMLDDRTFRSSEELPDSLNGRPNPNKPYWGAKQMQWLEDNLLASHATFKFIANGNQVIDPGPLRGEAVSHYALEYNRLIDFIRSNHIGGVVFLSGDRHFTEVQALPTTQTKQYPLLDYTCSPLSSTPYYNITQGVEANPPTRVPGSLFTQQNFGRIRITGPKGSRTLTIETCDVNGKTVWSKAIGESELK